MSTDEFERKQALLRDAFEGMQQVKVNYTDVRLSAMEDFIARGDRCAPRAATRPVLRRMLRGGSRQDAARPQVALRGAGARVGARRDQRHVVA